MSEKIKLTIQFFNPKTEEFTGKFYDYLIDEEAYFKRRHSFMTASFHFKISSGYDYRNANVRAVRASYYESSEASVELKEIVDFTFTTYPRIPEAMEHDFITIGEFQATKCCKNISNATSKRGSYSWENICPSTVTNLNSGLNPYLKQDTFWDLGQTNSATSIYPDISTIQVDKSGWNMVTNSGNSNISISNEKENKNMSKFGINFKFGAVPKHEVRMSMYGPAFKSNDGWYAYDGSDYRDVTDFLFGEENYCYMFPATDANIELGDYIYHNNGWCRIIDLDDSNRLIVEKIFSHEVVTVLPTKNIFGYEFYTKLMPLFGNMFTVSKEQPFGNMLPLMLMDQNADGKNLLMAMMATQGNMDMSNPFMMMALMDEKSGKNNIFEIMMLMQMMQPKHHKCEGKCKCHEENEEEN